ncbi:MAG: helix-turn-helix transcriptional regulator [Clostridia bacterium]|nr:helix-turn-helix transcriptional regulator [Clostridia bacterium]
MNKDAILTNFEKINKFNLYVDFRDIDENSDFEPDGSHIHDLCEIYINLAGDVSFMVENNIYPIKKGDIIITKPFEYHHCVYHSKVIHKYFCLWINPENNHVILDTFFQRNKGEGNKIVLSEENTERFTDICFELRNTALSVTRKYCLYFELLDLLTRGIKDPSNSSANNKLSQDILLALEYIDTNFKNEINIHNVATYAHTSINTLERHFKEALRTTPYAYINKKRLSHSVILLKNGYSVMEAAQESGFADYSGYIAKFKKVYGITPLKYKKSLR